MIKTDYICIQTEMKTRPWLINSNTEQAWVELCQAQASLDLPGFDFIFLDFAGLVQFERFGLICYFWFGWYGLEK